MLCALCMVCTSAVVLPVSSVEAKGAGTTYYVSSVNGDNKNNGLSADKAWQTLDKLQDVVGSLQPGDQILLESGSVFHGFIHLKDVHGTKENPIKISSYGNGAKPIINGDGQGIWYQDYVAALDNAGHRGKGYVSSTISLYDVDHVEVSDLEITNQSTDIDLFEVSDKIAQRMDRTGVSGIAKNGGTMEGITLKDLFIHDVDGNIQDKHMNNGGIQMNVLQPDNESETGIARYQDILIEGCYVKDVSRAGIVLGYTYNHARFNGSEISDQTVRTYGHGNVVFRNNYVQNSGNDGIVVMYADRPLVENNVSDSAGVDMLEYSYWQNFCCAIWPWKCKDAVFQRNEAFDTIGEGNGDGQAWDIDWSDGTVYQYNYSHNNGGGAMLVCLNEAYNGVFRYNISQNDLKCFITLQGNPRAEFYNNVFYVDGDRDTRIHHTAAGKRGGVAWLANNIFYNASSANPNDTWENNTSQAFTNNLYFGYNSTPTSDKKAVVVTDASTIFQNPGKAPTTTSGVVNDVSAFEGYKLVENSPAINAGVFVTEGNDFFGNAIGKIPDIGIHETDAEENVPSYAEYATTGMIATVGDYEKNSPTQGNGSLALDNNTNTMWHTSWSGTSQENCWITVDMGEVKPVSMYKYISRGGNNPNGRILEYEIYVSKDNSSWEKVTSGSWENDMNTKYAYFDSVDARYVKLVATKTYSSESNKIFASAVEVRVGYEVK